jgi:hypothetical protein
MGGSSWSAHQSRPEILSWAGRLNWGGHPNWAARLNWAAHPNWAARLNWAAHPNWAARLNWSAHRSRRNCETLQPSCGSIRRSRSGPDGILSSALPRRHANFRPAGAVVPNDYPSLPPNRPIGLLALLACPFHPARRHRAAPTRRDDQAGGNQKASNEFRRAIPPDTAAGQSARGTEPWSAAVDHHQRHGDDPQ